MPDDAQRPADGLVQIGDLARRVGIRADTLRVWERRYGLLQPQRSAGGFRLYSQTDERTVRAMVAAIEAGFPPSQAAKVAHAQRTGPSTAGSGADDPRSLQSAQRELFAAVMAFDGQRAQHALDTALDTFSLAAVLDQVVLTCLRQIGDGWADGSVDVAQEHFASQLLRERLLALARTWDQGSGPRALLACPPGELHDIALICLGLVLSRSGWRVTFLGTDTPGAALESAVAALRPDLVVVAATTSPPLLDIADSLQRIAAGHQLAVAGPGASDEVARATGGTAHALSPVDTARRLTHLARGAGP
jgi:DNA-binding transcriptional MerR regulator